MALEFCPDIVVQIGKVQRTHGLIIFNQIVFEFSIAVVTNEVIKNTTIQKTYYGIDRKLMQ